MRLLLTRAADDAARTRKLLVAAGHTVVASSVLLVRSLAPAWPPGRFDGIVASSARAFATLCADERHAPLKQHPLFLVGRQTETAARAQGWRGPALLAADGATLVDGLAGRPAMALLYLAGRDRKPDIERGLARAGHAVTTLETYCADAAPTLSPEATDALASGALDAVMHYSRRSALLFLALCDGAAVEARALPQIGLSEDVAAALREAGCGTVHVPATPDEAGMQAAVAALGARLKALST